MKQIAKTQQVIDRLRAAFGPDVDVSKLAVFEAVALNTLPLRKSGGIFKGAIPTQRTLTDMVGAINSESAPIQLQHDDSTVPFGRAFYCEVVDGEARTLFTSTDPAITAKIDNGTIDQVSVGFMPAALNCSACGWNYLGADSTFDNLFGLVCANDHSLGENGVHAIVDGIASFYELSLVGKGAANGAKIVGPTDSRLQGNQQFRLAADARADGFAGVRLTATPKENPVDLKEVLAQLTAATTESATAKAALTGMTAERDNALAQLTASTTRVTELETQLAAAPKPEDLTAAVAALKAEATTILTACGKEGEVASLEGKDASALLSVINEHRAQFAAAIPVGGRSNPAHQQPAEPAQRSGAAAFSTRR